MERIVYGAVPARWAGGVGPAPTRAPATPHRTPHAPHEKGKLKYDAFVLRRPQRRSSDAHGGCAAAVELARGHRVK